MIWDQGNSRRDPSMARYVLRCVLEKKKILDVSLKAIQLEHSVGGF